VDIFQNIKDGILPDDEIVFEFLDKDIVDNQNQEEIQKYIEILNNALKQSNTAQEKILLSKVIFVLERLILNEDAFKHFLFNIFTIHIHEVYDEEINFIDKLLSKIDENKLFDNLNNIIDEIDNESKENLRSFFNWIMHKIWNMNRFYVSEKFKLLYDSLKKLLIRLRDKNRIDEMMYVEFFTYHIISNGFQTIDEWREFNENVTKQTIKAYNQFIPSLSKPKNRKKSKQKIAFIKERIVFNSPYMVEYSLFKNLMNNKEFRDNYELIVYTFNQFEKNLDDEKLIIELENLGIKVKRPVDYFQKDGYYNNHLDKALTLRENLIDDEIDIMIAWGSYPILNFLYVTRTAPLQIYYSHGNCAYDVPNIDKRVSHFNQECKEFEWNIINVPIDEKFLVGSEGEKAVGDIIKKEYKEKFGEDVVILGTIGRLVKIDSDEYIKTISEIMKQNPNTIYLACGIGNKKSIKEKLKKYNIDEERFIFTGMVKPHVYGWVIDVWCDSFPLTQGQSKDEFRAKKKPVVFYRDDIKQTERNKSYVSKNIGEYIKNINELIKDKNKREKVGELGYKDMYKTFTQVDFKKMIE